MLLLWTREFYLKFLFPVHDATGLGLINELFQRLLRNLQRSTELGSVGMMSHMFESWVGEYKIAFYAQENRKIFLPRGS